MSKQIALRLLIGAITIYSMNILPVSGWAAPKPPKRPRTTPLHDAARAGQVKEIQRLLKQGADVNVLNKRGETPLHEAAWADRVEVTKLLLKEGAAANPPADGKRTAPPLTIAAERGRLDIVELLLDADASIDAVSEEERFGVFEDTALQAAAKNGQLAVARRLLEAGANVNLGVVHDLREVDGESLRDGNRLVLNRGHTALHDAAQSGNVEMVELLIDKGGDVNAATDNGVLPLHQGATNGRIVQLLVKLTDEVNARDPQGTTPLHLACEHGEVQAVALLIKHGADVEAATNNHSLAVRGGRPLHCIALGRQAEEKAQLLIEAGASITAQDDDGKTPIDLARELKRKDLVQLLENAAKSN